MLILLHAIWFPYMLPNLVYPEQGSIKQREQKKKTKKKHNKHVVPIIWQMYMFMRIQWLEKIVVVHEFVMVFFKLEEKSEVTVETTTLI